MRLLAVLLAVLLGAGCIGQDAPTDVSTASKEGASLDPAVIVDPTSMLEDGALPAGADAAPVWAVGDAWAIRTGDGETEESSFLVVTEASPDSSTRATTSDTLAGYDAMFDVSYVGKVRARDLAGHQQGEPIQYFDFPLADGKTWTTKWDGFDIALAAKKTARGFDITGTRDGEPYVTYDFVPEMKWWSHLQFAAGYGLHVDRLAPGWAGELAQATASVVFEMGPAAPIASPGAGAFTIDEGQTMAMVTIAGGGQMWARALQFVDPSGAPHMTDIQNFEVADAAAAPNGYFYQEPLPPTPGEWHVAAPTLHDPSGSGFVTVHQVAVAKLKFP